MFLNLGCLKMGGVQFPEFVSICFVLVFFFPNFSFGWFNTALILEGKIYLTWLTNQYV